MKMQWYCVHVNIVYSVCVCVQTNIYIMVSLLETHTLSPLMNLRASY